MTSRWYCLSLIVSSGVASAASADTTILYSNDFETPNRPVQASCGGSLDQSGINLLYGSDGFMFAQQFTVEAVTLHDSGSRYMGQDDERNGQLAIGMLSTAQEDRLALTFDAQGLPFLNLGMDISSIDVQGCGGPFGVVAPVYQLSLLDSPGGVFDWNQTVLDTEVVTGIEAADAWTFAWTNVVAGLDAGGSTDGHVTVVLDLLESGYAALDNLTITASTESGVVDSDLDGVTGDVDNCPNERNDDQQNMDEDIAGDVCDPAPRDPESCGDIDQDGADDCEDFCANHDVASCGGDEDAATVLPDDDMLDASQPDEMDASKPRTDASTALPKRDAAFDDRDPEMDAGRADASQEDSAGGKGEKGCGCATVGAARTGHAASWLALGTSLVACAWRLRRRAARV